jgi:hypothetical protein
MAAPNSLYDVILPFSIGTLLEASSSEQEVVKVSKLTRTKRIADLHPLSNNAEGPKRFD